MNPDNQPSLLAARNAHQPEVLAEKLIDAWEVFFMSVAEYKAASAPQKSQAKEIAQSALSEVKTLLQLTQAASEPAADTVLNQEIAPFITNIIGEIAQRPGAIGKVMTDVACEEILEDLEAAKVRTIKDLVALTPEQLKEILGDNNTKTRVVQCLLSFEGLFLTMFTPPKLFELAKLVVPRSVDQKSRALDLPKETKLNDYKQRSLVRELLRIADFNGGSSILSLLATPALLNQCFKRNFYQVGDLLRLHESGLKQIAEDACCDAPESAHYLYFALSVFQRNVAEAFRINLSDLRAKPE